MARYIPRLSAGMNPDVRLSAAERKRLRELTATLGTGTAPDALRDLVAVCLSCREARAGAKHDAKRADVLAQIAAIEEHARGLRDALAAVSLEGLARLDDVDPGMDLIWPKRLSGALHQLEARAHHARTTLAEEGAEGGRTADRAQSALLAEAKRLWIASGHTLERGSDYEGRGPSPWERFATALLAVAMPGAARPREGLKAARSMAPKRPKRQRQHTDQTSP